MDFEHNIFKTRFTALTFDEKNSNITKPLLMHRQTYLENYSLNGELRVHLPMKGCCASRELVLKDCGIASKSALLS